MRSRFESLPPGIAGCLFPPDRLSGTGLGQCVIAGSDWGSGVVIVQADPAIAISGYLLSDWHDGAPDCVSLECQGDPDHIGDLIRVEAAGRRVIYAVTRVADRENGVWEARWPD